MFSCRGNTHLASHETNINQELNNEKRIKYLELDTINSFVWDELLVTGPYKNLDEIPDYDLSTFPSNSTSYDEYLFFGFLKDKRGIKWMSIERHPDLDKLFKTKKLNYIILEKENSKITLDY